MYYKYKKNGLEKKIKKKYSLALTVFFSEIDKGSESATLQKNSNIYKFLIMYVTQQVYQISFGSKKDAS